MRRTATSGPPSQAQTTAAPKATDERPVKIYFFRSNGDSYEQMALIEISRKNEAAKSGMSVCATGQR